MDGNRCTRHGNVLARVDHRSLDVIRAATDAYPEVVGGGAIHAHAMSKWQTGMGYRVTLLASDHGDRERPATERHDGYEVRRYRELAQPLGNSITSGMVTDLWRLTAEHDVVHTHLHPYFSTNLVAVLGCLADTSLVVTNYRLFSRPAPTWFQKGFLPTVGRLTFDSAERVLCYTDTDYERLRDRCLSAKIAVIHNGI